MNQAWPLYCDNHVEMDHVRHVRRADVPRIQLDRLQYENPQAVAVPRPLVQIIVPASTSNAFASKRSKTKSAQW